MLKNITVMRIEILFSFIKGTWNFVSFQIKYKTRSQIISKNNLKQIVEFIILNHLMIMTVANGSVVYTNTHNLIANHTANMEMRNP
jgi:hypothetical protein